MEMVRYGCAINIHVIAYTNFGTASWYAWPVLSHKLFAVAVATEENLNYLMLTLLRRSALLC